MVSAKLALLALVQADPSGSYGSYAASYSPYSSYVETTTAPTPAPETTTNAPTPAPETTTNAPTPAPDTNTQETTTKAPTFAPTPAPTLSPANQACFASNEQLSKLPFSSCIAMSDGEDGATFSKTLDTCGGICKPYLDSFKSSCTGTTGTMKTQSAQLITAMTCAADYVFEYKVPTFDITAFDFTSATPVDLSAITWVAATTAPTPAPPPAPTGMSYVTKKVEKAEIKAEVGFPVTVEQGNSAKMQAVFINGYATALGLNSANVKISKVTAKARRLEAVSSTRRLAGSGINVEFTATVPKESAAAVKAGVETAASSGAIVSNIKKEAQTAGVLSAELKTMEPKVTVTATAATVEVEVRVLSATNTVVPTQAPTQAPTKADGNAFSAATSVCPAFVSMFAIFMVSMACAF